MDKKDMKKLCDDAFDVLEVLKLGVHFQPKKKPN